MKLLWVRPPGLMRLRVEARPFVLCREKDLSKLGRRLFRFDLLAFVVLFFWKAVELWRPALRFPILTSRDFLLLGVSLIRPAPSSAKLFVHMLNEAGFLILVPAYEWAITVVETSEFVPSVKVVSLFLALPRFFAIILATSIVALTV